MKILQLVTKRQYRGAEVFAANLSSELIKLGHEIIFAGLYRNENNILHVTDAANIDLSAGKNGNFSPGLVLNIVRLIKRVRPDVIQCNGSDTLKYMIAASFFSSRIPLVYRNISMISEWLSNKPKKLFYRRMFTRIDHVSSVGEEAVEDFIRTFDYPKNQTSVIRRGIPIKTISPSSTVDLKREFSLKETDKIVMHIGNFSPEKNHMFLLEIFSELKYEQPEIKLVCVGNGALFEDIKLEINKKKLEDTVFLTGFRKDIPELLDQSEAFVLASKVEGVPGVILEAAAQRKPSVATNVGGVFEVLIDGETGFMINDFNKEDFKNKLLKLMNDKELCVKMGYHAYELVKESFNPVKNARKFETLYRQLICNQS